MGAGFHWVVLLFSSGFIHATAVSEDLTGIGWYKLVMFLVVSVSSQISGLGAFRGEGSCSSSFVFCSLDQIFSQGTSAQWFKGVSTEAVRPHGA